MANLLSEVRIAGISCQIIYSVWWNGDVELEEVHSTM